MRTFAKRLTGIALCSSLITISPVFAAVQSNQPKDQGHIEFRVGASTSKVISGARVIVIDHDGKIIDSGLTNSRGILNVSVPLHEMKWEQGYDSQGIVNAIVIANGYNEGVVFVIPKSQNTVQPVVLQPIVQKGDNLPAAMLGNYSKHDLVMYVNHYAEELKLKRQPEVAGNPRYAPWSPEQK